jgi:hypothetical protein
MNKENAETKNENKHNDLQSHYRHGASKKKNKWELNLGCPHNTPACYQLSYCKQHD